MDKASVVVWGGYCKNVINGSVCGTPMMVRPSKNFGNQLEIPSITRTSTQTCPKCGLPNQFADAELTEGLSELPEV